MGPSNATNSTHRHKHNSPWWREDATAASRQQAAFFMLSMLSTGEGGHTCTHCCYSDTQPGKPCRMFLGHSTCNTRTSLRTEAAKNYPHSVHVSAHQHTYKHTPSQPFTTERSSLMYPLLRGASPMGTMRVRVLSVDTHTRTHNTHHTQTHTTHTHSTTSRHTHTPHLECPEQVDLHHPAIMGEQLLHFLLARGPQHLGKEQLQAGRTEDRQQQGSCDSE